MATTTVSIPNAKRRSQPVPAVEARMRRAIAGIAECDCPVLILGEHGAGKRTTAAQIHAQSSQPRGSFTEIRCIDATAESLQSALAAKGSVYLDEVSDLTLTLQELIVHAYLRGAQQPPARLLCGSCRELPQEVKSWRMREDFYYFVSAISLRIPPLRYRKYEILSIADELMTQYAKQFDRPKPVLCKEIVGHLLEHSWPGNLAELQTAMKTFVAIGDQAISLAAIKAAAPAGRTNGNRRHLLLKEATRASSIQLERQLISEVLVSTGGNRKRAAIDLGISYKALLYKLKQIESDNPPAFCKNGEA
ncbi:MAG: sigma 54-interacting transcriptional regulator [Terracidiphilus sp.]